MRQSNRFLVALLLFVVCARGRAEDSPDFSRDVRPILSDKCYKCHGPDGTSREADLRFDRRSSAAYVLLNEDGTSELVRRITSDDPDEQMPPPTSKLALSQPEIDTLRQWVAEGADYEEHWAFRPIRKPPLPQVQQKSWPRNEIDVFVLARLEQEGLSPAPTAGRERLIRRISFDITGLPPTLDEIDQFLADQSEKACERLVDRLLASPSFGERMAANWLDVARYADSYGYQVDRERRVWPWRDWVIGALNDNMPYDQFISWQLAGDLLPDATDQQRLATTFNRLHSQKVEGGSVPEEFRVEYVADRTQTVATAFLGLTMQCARCHDHKYDPITQQEFYQLFAFFNNIDECGVYSYFTDAVPTPTLLLWDEQQQAEIADIQQRVLRAEESLRALVPTRHDAFTEWLTQTPAQRRLATPPAPAPPAGPPDSAEQADAVGDLTADQAKASDDRTTGTGVSWALPHIPGRIAHVTFEEVQQGENRSASGVRGKAVCLSGDEGIGLEVGNFRRCDPFSVALWINTPDVKERAVIFHRSRAWTDAGSRGYQLLIEDGKLSASLIHFWPGNALRIMTRAAVPINQWLHVAVTYDGSSQAGGLRIYVDGKEADCEVVRDHLYKQITGGGGDHITIGERFRDRGFTDGLVDEFQVFQRELTPIEVAQLHDGVSLDNALATPSSDLTGTQQRMLHQYYLATVDQPYRDRRAALHELREEQDQAVDRIEEIMVMSELPQPRPTFLLRRGAYDAPADRVWPATPSVLPAFPDNQPRNRLALAAWLTDPDHPLTARVTVNRIWQLLFGDGLVRTPEDFGSQGKPPTHPRLLDWLARDFIDHRWDLKRLIKMIVMSSTYRQDSVFTSELLARDPENLWLARGPRYRWPAEMLRDHALATSGLLVNRIGGAPAKPYEVSVSFKPLEPDKGSGLYRRSLYTYWKRTAPAPVMMTLDAVKRDVCAVKREQTASPLQSLVLMNDPQLLEAARVLAERLLTEHPESVEAAMGTLFRTLTSRRANDQELQVLGELFRRQLARFNIDAERAERFLQTGAAPADSALPAPQVAAMTVVVSTVMNFDECVTKR